ncbi:MAG: ral secretion pathway protein GspD [Phycisphaerales bacterium]|nr:ral secretion pathway protein GspD [Phycisphaerales bacterium]MDB5357382.1 ral secretion pathway protein GspD [Phycisphaerales bacterium]
MAAVLAVSAAQVAAEPATAPASDRPVTMDFPAEGVELRLLADIVTKRLKIPILYDETINNKRVVIRVPVDVPESSLLGVLQSALRMKQMALVDAEQPGWMKIVPAQNLTALAKPAVSGKPADAGMAMTQVFIARHVDPARLAESVRPYLTTPGGNAQPAAGQKALVVSDYPSVVTRVGQLIALLDAEAPPVAVKLIPLRQADAGQVATVVSQLIANKESSRWGAGSQPDIFISAEDRSNQVVVIAPTARMSEVAELVAAMDEPLNQETKIYRLTTLSPERLDRLMKSLLGSAGKRSYQSSIDRESHSLVVTATPEVQVRIAALVKEVDVPESQEQSPVRFYKLKNTKAADVLATITGLYSEGGPGGYAAENSGDETQFGPSNRNGSGPSVPSDVVPAPAANPAPPGGSSGSAPGQRTGTPRRMTALAAGGPNDTGNGLPASPGSASSANSTGLRYGPGSAGSQDESVEGGVSAVHGRNANVTADVNTNSIIVIAPPAVQQQYADLIRHLDERRPQVQIECTIVTLDTSDGFSFGVDIGRKGGTGNGDIISFSSFGVSTVDPTSGLLTPGQAAGGTFALLDPRIANIVLRALSNNTRSRLVSSPQILVNDNGKGKLESVSQQPFAEILDTSVQSRTGLGGLAQAGTTISVEPHISEGDYLQLGYSVELSNFTGAGSNGLPPPSEKNAVDSTVTIPDGYTIVVGGLSLKSLQTAVNSVPVLGDIPILKYLFSSRSRTKSDTTLFVFIRPVILRDDKFEDLKYLSGKSMEAAGLPGDFPSSDPIPLR